MKECEVIMKLHKKLLKSEIFPFPKKGKVDVSIKQGVYIIYNLDNAVLHVGTTKRGKDGLNQRLNNHRTGSSSFSKNYLVPQSLSLENGLQFKYIEIEKGRTRVLLEGLTAGLLCPVYIGTGEKKI